MQREITNLTSLHISGSYNFAFVLIDFFVLLFVAMRFLAGATMGLLATWNADFDLDLGGGTAVAFLLGAFLPRGFWTAFSVFV